MPLTEKQWATLAGQFRSALARAAPEWTDTNAHDPGRTLLEVLCYAITDLQQRGGVLDEHARLLARTVAERAGQLAGTARGGDDDCGPGLQRVNYTAGMLLGVDDFRTEQQYLRGRLQRQNRLLHGTGIACGLNVTVEQGSARIEISPGLALDPVGNEICIEQPVHLALPSSGPDLFVLLRYAERPCRSAPVVPGAGGQDADSTMDVQPTRIVETFTVELASAPQSDAVVIARLRQSRGRWRVDARYKVTRVHGPGCGDDA